MTNRSVRVLIVEDEGLLALALKDTLSAVGYTVIGPAPSTQKALKLIATEAIDAALLDINLGNERVDSVAQALDDADIPFIFSTGYCNKSALPPDFMDRKVLGKPFGAGELLQAIGQLVGNE